MEVAALAVVLEEAEDEVAVEVPEDPAELEEPEELEDPEAAISPAVPLETAVPGRLAVALAAIAL
jgi:hypothetical protein